MGKKFGFLGAENQDICKLIRPKEKIMPMQEAAESNEDVILGDEADAEESKEADESGEERKEEDDKDGLSHEVVTEDEEATEEGEEGRKAVGSKIPQKVSKDERQAHELTHTPYRAWCKHCVRGRGKNRAHKKSTIDKGEIDVPRVSIDYFYMSSEDEKASKNPLIVMVDEGTGEKYARAVGRKGLGDEGEMDWLLKDLSTELKVWGHPGGDGSSLILKCDTENSIIVVRDGLAKYHGGRIVPESPAKNESQSNGVVEEAGKTVREFTRVLKDQLESEANVKVKAGDVITLWMVRWAAMMVSRFLVGIDGRTAHERRRGRKCNIPVVRFGELVWYKRMRESKERKDKFESEWFEGIWLGHSRASNEILIGTADGIVRTYTVQRKVEGEQWSATDIENMKGTPHQPDPTKPGDRIPIIVKFDEPNEEEAVRSEAPRKDAGRRMAISAAILRKYGYSDGCEGCRFYRAGIQDPNARKPHSEVCRTRIRDEMAKDEKDKEKVEHETDRINRMIAEKLQKDEEAKEKAKEDEERTGIKVDEPLIEERPKKKSRKDGKETILVRGRERIVRARYAEEETADTGGSRSSGSGGAQGDVLEPEESAKRRRKGGIGDELFEGDNFDEDGDCILYLTDGFNFEKTSDRKRVLKMLEDVSPALVVGSPVCWSGKAGKPSKRHERFVLEVYKSQAEKGKWFIHENVSLMNQFFNKEIERTMGPNQVYVGKAKNKDFNIKSLKEDKSKRRFCFATNSKVLESKLTREMNKDEAKDETKTISFHKERYSKELCFEIQQGVKEEVKLKGQGLKKLMTVPKLTAVQQADVRGQATDLHLAEVAYDDVSGQVLCPKEVRRARLTEIEFVKKKNVYVKIPRRLAILNGWKIVKTRWIDVNKGDEKNPLYRSRFVAKEFNDCEAAGMFAATPPLEALKILISDASTIRRGEDYSEKVLMINDVARAFFEAPVRRDICIELPAEDYTEEDGEQDMVGHLVQSLYGTRDAAANFQHEVKKIMTAIGFEQGKYNVSTYFHKKKNLKTLVHGDDFVTTGKRVDVAWLREKLAGRFEIKTTVVGMGTGEAREARLLNRILSIDANGWRYEADPRHAELIIRGLNLTDAKGVKSPGEDVKPWSEDEDAEALGTREATDYRALAARGNYLSPDRPDIQYAVKECCRGMASPTRGDLKKLRRLGRYLVERPRMVLEFPYQESGDTLYGYSDSDWAGCKRTAKSTSGGCMLLGKHCIKSWSSTQKSITLSSAEAELVAAVKMSAELIGVEQLMAEWGWKVHSEVLVDSSAALGVVNRKGNGKLRHVRVGMLWIQEKQENEELTYKKVPGTENPADLMTKNLAQSIIDSHLVRINAIILSGRAELAPEL